MTNIVCSVLCTIGKNQAVFSPVVSDGVCMQKPIALLWAKCRVHWTHGNRKIIIYLYPFYVNVSHDMSTTIGMKVVQLAIHKTIWNVWQSSQCKGMAHYINGRDITMLHQTLRPHLLTFNQTDAPMKTAQRMCLVCLWNYFRKWTLIVDVR